jgi:hypothetical protein
LGRATQWKAWFMVTLKYFNTLNSYAGTHLCERFEEVV